MSDETKELISLIKNDLYELKETQIRIEEDIRHHIRRTDKLEEMTSPIYKTYIGVRWSLGAIIAMGAVIASIGKFKGLF